MSIQIQLGSISPAKGYLHCTLVITNTYFELWDETIWVLNKLRKMGVFIDPSFPPETEMMASVADQLRKIFVNPNPPEDTAGVNTAGVNTTELTELTEVTEVVSPPHGSVLAYENISYDIQLALNCWSRENLKTLLKKLKMEVKVKELFAEEKRRITNLVDEDD